MARRRGGNKLDGLRRHFIDEHVKVVFRPAGPGQPPKAAVTVYGVSEKEARSKRKACTEAVVYSVLFCPRWPGC